MVKKPLIIAISLVSVAVVSRLAFAAEQTGTAAEIQKAQDMGNKICPVTGEKIEEKLKATYEYEGKVYNFCCPVCIEEFKKDPQKYIKKIEEELKASSAQQDGGRPSKKSADRGMTNP